MEEPGGVVVVVNIVCSKGMFGHRWQSDKFCLLSVLHPASKDTSEKH